MWIAGTRWKSPDSWSSALASGPCRGWIARLGPGGEERLQVELGGPGGRVTISRAAVGASGALVFTGTIQGRQKIGGVDLDGGPGPKERAYLARADPDGKIAWARLHEPASCVAVDGAERVITASPKGVFVDGPDGQAIQVLSIQGEFPARISDCRVDGEGHLYLAGTAPSGGRIGESTLPEATRKRAKTAWLRVYETGFVARIAIDG